MTLLQTRSFPGISSDLRLFIFEKIGLCQNWLFLCSSMRQRKSFGIRTLQNCGWADSMVAQSLISSFVFVSFSCPPGHMLVENATGRHCIYTACAQRPCNFGTCVSQSASKFRCHCPDGYAGRNCEITLAIFTKDAGLSFSSMFAICICFLALLGSYGNYVLYYLW